MLLPTKGTARVKVVRWERAWNIPKRSGVNTGRVARDEARKARVWVG